MSFTWTKDSPTVDGWWWLRLTDTDGTVEDGVIHVERHRHFEHGVCTYDKMCVYVPASRDYMPIEGLSDCSWSDRPIQPPQVEAELKSEIDRLVDRFVSWPLPATVCSDRCACEAGYRHRTGTNLMTADEARQMILHLLAPKEP